MGPATLRFKIATVHRTRGSATAITTAHSDIGGTVVDSATPDAAVAGRPKRLRRVRGETITRVAWLAVFIHVAILQMRFAPSRPDRPNNFGGSFVFYTVQCNLILLGYSTLSTIESLCGSRAPVRLTKMCSAASGCCWTLGSLMGTLYYAFVHWHPLTRERAQQIVSFDRYMHMLHLSPVLFVAWDTIFMESEKIANYALRFRTEVMIVAAYACSYMAWLLVIVRRTSWWPYPFLAQLSPQGLTGLFAAVLFCAIPGASYVGRKVRCCGTRRRHVSHARHLHHPKVAKLAHGTPTPTTPGTCRLNCSGNKVGVIHVEATARA